MLKKQMLNVFFVKWPVVKMFTRANEALDQVRLQLAFEKGDEAHIYEMTTTEHWMTIGQILWSSLDSLKTLKCKTNNFVFIKWPLVPDGWPLAKIKYWTKLGCNRLKNVGKKTVGKYSINDHCWPVGDHWLKSLSTQNAAWTKLECHRL